LQLVTHAHFGHGPLTYHARAADEHAHLVCARCGGVIEIPPDALREIVERLRDDYGFVVDVTHVAISGVCAPCATPADG
jgi:Fur family ferric uptake transcriptional regulator